jgi:hypothetical protein
MKDTGKPLMLPTVVYMPSHPAIQTRLDCLTVDFQQRCLAVCRNQFHPLRTGLSDAQHRLPAIDYHHGTITEQADHAHVRGGGRDMRRQGEHGHEQDADNLRIVHEFNLP